MTGRRSEASLVTDEMVERAWKAGVDDIGPVRLGWRWDKSALRAALRAVERDIAEAAHEHWPYRESCGCERYCGDDDGPGTCKSLPRKGLVDA